MNKQERLNNAIDVVFSKYDTNKSNTLEHHELKVVLKDVFAKLKLKKEVSDEDVDKMIKAYDTDKDGQISKEEFRALVEKCIK